MKRDPKVIVIGIDGATWELVEPWVNENKLPAFKRLMENGAYGALESTMPASTFPAWESMFTGQNPGKLGVFDFLKVDVIKRTFEVNTTNSFNGESLWKILNQYGYKTCVVGVPTSKIQPINGVMVGGPFSFKRRTYPIEFQRVLDALNYEPYPKEFTKLFIETSENEPPIERIKKVIKSRFILAEYLLETEEPDFLAFVIFLVDNIQHFFWGEPLVFQTWKVIDEEIDKFTSRHNSIIFVVSDHGFTKLSKTVYLSKLLRDKRLITYNENVNLKIARKLNTNTLIKIGKIFKLDKILPRLLKEDTLLAFLSRFPDQSGRLGADGLEVLIDWEKSKCIPISSVIYLNCNEENKGKLKETLKKELKSYTDLIDDVYFKDEIYSGPYLDDAPDIIIKPKKGVRLLESPFVDETISYKLAEGWKGNHAVDGLFLIYGPNIKKTQTNMSILDITPTILHFYDIPPSRMMDGKVQTKIVN